MFSACPQSPGSLVSAAETSAHVASGASPRGRRAGAWEGCVCPFLAPLSLLAQLGPRRMGCLGRGRSCRSGASRCPTLSRPPEGQLRGPLRCSFGSLQLILMTRGTCPRLCHLSLESCPPRPLGRPPPTDIPLPPGSSPASFQGGLWPRPPACGFSRALGTRAAVRGVWKPAPEVTQSHPPLPLGHRPPKKAPPFSRSHVGRDRGRLAWGGVGWGVDRWTTRGACLSCQCSGAAGRVTLSVPSLVLASWESQPTAVILGLLDLRRPSMGSHRGPAS